MSFLCFTCGLRATACWILNFCLCGCMPGRSSQCLVNGISLFEGAVWSPEPCSVCQCKDGATSCRTIPCPARGLGTTISSLFMSRKLKRTAFKWEIFEIEILCKIINVFTDTFKQFNVFLLNKNINLILLTPNLWTVGLVHVPLWLFDCYFGVYFEKVIGLAICSKS